MRKEITSVSKQRSSPFSRHSTESRKPKPRLSLKAGVFEDFKESPSPNLGVVNLRENRMDNNCCVNMS